ncbi:MAG: hypothetical protein JNK85_26825 [Verrucomicrobiales bacterium]|nr:hypothetical protein [Verrucomicrobiales bacterium]
MNDELRHRLQAWVDGQLDAKAAEEIARLVETEPEARQLSENLRQVRQLVRSHEPVRRVPDSRDFYWSRIRQGIELAEAQAARKSTPAPASGRGWTWWRWLLPVAGVALVVVVLRPHAPSNEVSPPPGPLTVAQAPVTSNSVVSGHEIETPSPELTSLTFYSAQDAMTVVWVGSVDML